MISLFTNLLKNSFYFKKEFLKYFFVSLLGLFIDLLTFSICLRIIYLTWAWSASIAFCLGLISVYCLSIFFVFSKRKIEKNPLIEFIIFFVIGLLGLVITQLCLYSGIELLKINAEISKLIASGFTFLFNYIVRKIFLF